MRRRRGITRTRKRGKIENQYIGSFKKLWNKMKGNTSLHASFTVTDAERHSAVQELRACLW
jgi:hypothetical protein